MNNELTIKINSKNHKVFLQNGAYSHRPRSAHLHKHNYAEIHIIAENECEFIIGSETYIMKEGDLLVIPREISHAFKQGDSLGLHAAFQVDFPFTEFSACKVPKEIVLDFLKEIDLCKENGDHARVAAYISLFCSFLNKNQPLSATPITDYGFLITEFFSNRYSENIHLSDLAEILHLSSRQTERLVIKYTGKAFREALSDIRIRTAKHLIENTSMSFSDICSYVGYQSYAGFFKAMKRYDENQAAIK